jgi:hypothetical protein
MKSSEGNKKEMVSLRVPIEMNKRLSDHVRAIGSTKNSFILNLIDKALRGGKAS